MSHYLSTNTYPATSEISYSFIGGLSQSQITLIAPLVTYSTKHLGTKTTLFIGVVFETAALIAASFATQVWHLYLTQGLLFGWGCSFLYIGTIGIIPQWFHKSRGIANGIAAAGSGLGGLAFSLGSDAMITSLGVAWSFRITAICAATVNIVCALLIRDRNKHINPEQHGFNIRLLKRPELLWITSWAALSILGYTIVLFSLPNNGHSIGLSSRQGSILAALVNMGMAIGRPFVGFLSDKLGRVKVVALATILAGVLCFCLWTTGKTYSILLAFSVLGGTVVGTSWAVSKSSIRVVQMQGTNSNIQSIGPLLADAFGTKLLPSALSIVWTLISFPSCCKSTQVKCAPLERVTLTIYKLPRPLLWCSVKRTLTRSTCMSKCSQAQYSLQALCA